MALLGFLLVSGLLLHVFDFVPTGIGVVFVHGFGGCAGFLAEVLLIYHAICADDESHHARGSVFRRIGDESESFGHFAVCDVVFRAARGVFSLTS